MTDTPDPVVEVTTYVEYFQNAPDDVPAVYLHDQGPRLTIGHLRGIVAELKQLRAEHQILLDGNQRLQVMNNGLRQLAVEAREAADGWHRATIDLYSGRVEQPPGVAGVVFDGLQSLINDMRDRPSPFKEFEARQAAERETARSADVPDELIQAAADVLAQNGLWGAWERQQTEDEVRDILTAVLPLHTQPTCCVCGSSAVVYRNYREQPFCGPCADGVVPAERQRQDDGTPR